MLNLGPAARIFLAAGVTDLRKSFDTLAGVVRNRLGQDPLSGWFVFCNARRNRIKILFWDRNGFWVCAKRLEKGTFDWPEAAAPPGAWTLEYDQLILLLGGLEWKGMKRRSWYERTPQEKCKITN